MKMTILVSLLFALLGTQVFGQVRDPKETAKRKTENRANQKIDNTIDNGLNKLENVFGFGKKKKKKKKGQENDEQVEQSGNGMPDLAGMMGGGSVEVADSYDFKGHMNVRMTQVTKNGKKREQQDMRYLLPTSEESAFGIEMVVDAGGNKESTFTVMDWQNGAIITVLEEQKILTAMSFDNEAMLETTDETVEDYDEQIEGLKKTGNTKSILGYTCHEYTMDDEETSGTVWITDEIEGLDASRLVGGMGMAMKQKNKLPENYPTGMFLEGHWTDKKSGDESHWETTELDLDADHSLSTTGYQVLNLGGR
ncbi:MAG: DUF4412 domain-containing protein [Bacteroidota bacterium]